LLCFLIQYFVMNSTHHHHHSVSYQHIYTSPSVAATMYEHFEASSIFMDVGHSIFSLVNLHFFCQLQYIHALTWECLYCSFLKNVVSTSI
jgi:hypothetical protein